MGKKETPNIMIYEAAEGSLGILSEIIANPVKMQSLFRESYRLMHFDPETHENLRPDLPKASYEVLLSYYNQRHHDQLDRFGIQDALKKLMECHVDTKQGTRTREEQYQYLLSQYDKSSSTERSFIDHLYKNGYVLPDEAQKNIRYCYVNADFIFNTVTGQVIIFCDGSVHDDWQVKEEDKTKRQCLDDHGYDVIVWHYKTPLDEVIENRKDVFRKIK
jgi:very-short-patch-repair endonuclease